jgi:Rod binding domain-containing protein
MSVARLGDLPSTKRFPADDTSNTARLSSAAKEFESVLLGQWLKDAESTFGSVPGSEEDDAGGEQMKEFAMQHVASDIADRGGIGIAPMVERALAKQETPQVTQTNGEGH